MGYIKYFHCKNQLIMVNKSFVLPSLPWPEDSLQPYISSETISFHYGKHHFAYVKKLNESVNEAQKKMSIEELIKNTSGKIFNCAAQVWNHTFYWNCLRPNPELKLNLPNGLVAEQINRSFGDFDNFKKQFNATAEGHFGSGWAWLVLNEIGKLEVIGTHDAGNPITDNMKPILVCDVWEHAYYIDYQNLRSSYIRSWWSLVNWDWANQQLSGRK